MFKLLRNISFLFQKSDPQISFGLDLFLFEWIHASFSNHISNQVLQSHENKLLRTVQE